MPKSRICSFCGKDIPPGHGLLYVQRTGNVLHFCSNKCKRSQLDFKRDPKKLKYTKKYEKKIV
ncbi:MAG: 50S ribosomal protein L24e [Candidatus Heimdallarchaeaceae archaeon]